MAIKLICVHPFHGVEKGQEVTDPERVAELLGADHEGRFVKVSVPDAPATDAAPAVSDEAPARSRSRT